MADFSITSSGPAITRTSYWGSSLAFAVSITGLAYVALLGVAVLIGLVASIAGLRRAVRIDPALAFGGA